MELHEINTKLVLLPSDEENDMEMLQKQEDMRLSDLQEAVTNYVVGYIVQKVRQKLSFIICAMALTESINIRASAAHLRLILTKQRGGLLTLSTAVSAVIDRCEKTFRVLVSGDTILKMTRHVRLIHLCVFCSCSPMKAVHMVEVVETVEMLEMAEMAKIGKFLLFLLSPGDNVLPTYFASANQGSLLVT